MCGIAGILNLRGSFSAEKLRHVVTDMTGRMVHRGPDDSGIWIAPNNSCAFGQRRLSIIDLSAAGHQPMLSQDGRVAITFNGEIYNYQELRAELEGHGVRFRTQTDTEVLIESVRAWGDRAFQKMDGMYAFALFDEATGDVIIGRDPFGEKPLYYTHNADYFAFASELHCLTVLPGFDFGVDDAAVAELLMLQYIHAPRTMYRSAKKLPPGHFMRISPQGSVSITQHFAFMPRPAPYANRSIVDLADELQEILVRSIKRRMISDVPLGAFLSGGVDSSLVVALMAKECGRDVQTFSIGFAGDKDSEHEFARATARHLGTTHHEKILAPDVIRLVEHIAGVLDEPNADSSCLPVYLLSEFAREKVTVAISGDGGDELFGGYGRYFATLDEEARRLEGDPQFANWRAGDTYFGSRVCIFSQEQAERVMGRMPDEANQLMHGFKDYLNYGELPLMHRMREIDTRTYMSGAVLAKVDRMSMQHALEVRTPFLSIEVARFAEKLSPEQCYQNGQGKLILKELLCRYLPREFVYRPKQGFGLPPGVWGKDTLLPALKRSCDAPASRVQDWLPRGRIKRFLSEQERNFSTYQVWNVLMLEMWLRGHRADRLPSSSLSGEMNSFTRALLPFCDKLPLLEALSVSERSAAILVDETPPPTYLERFFTSLTYVKAPLDINCKLITEELIKKLPLGSCATILFGAGFDGDDITLIKALRDKGFKRLFFKSGTDWRGTDISSFLYSSTAWPLCKMTRLMSSKVTAFFTRVRRAIARRVLDRLALDVFPMSSVVRADHGLGWQAQIPQFLEWSNDVGIKRSDLLLFEGETLLEKDASHSDIREKGCGCYTHWGDSLYFSTTDNSNPLENGRRYRIIHKPRKTKLLRALWLAPERFFDSVAQPSDSLAAWGADVRYRLESVNPISLTKPRKQQEWMSDERRLRVFKDDVASKRPHGARALGAKSSGVVIFTSHLGPGGAERQVSYLADALKRRDINVSVISEASPEGALGHYVPTLSKAGVQVAGLPEASLIVNTDLLIRPEVFPDVDLARKLPQEFISSVQSLFVVLMREKPAVLHCFLDTPNIVGAVAGYLAGVPKIVLSARNVNPTHFDYLNSDWYLPWYRAVLSIPSVSFTANSKAGRDSYAEWIGIDPASIAVIPNAIDLHSFSGSTEKESSRMREAFGIQEGAPVMLGVFRLSHEKRPLLFIDVAREVKRRIPDLRVLIAGVGTMRDEVEREIESGDLGDFITLLGRRDDVAELIKSSDVMALLSENEGLPNVVLEAQALGRPVVCTAVGGAPDIVRDGVTGYLVGKDDRAAMVQRLVEILLSPDRGRSMGSRAVDFVASEFSLARLSARTLAAYGDLELQPASSSVKNLAACGM
jgi:asparagine synthase (glutamine-hydrolysing)